MQLLEQFGEELDSAAAVSNAISLPTTARALDAMDIDMEMEHLPTLDECNEMSNAMGEAAGISNNTLSIDVLQQSNDVNGIRNVRLRQAQAQQSSGVGPAFNEEMKAKWIELWSEGPNPSDGRVSVRDWYEKKKTKYMIWMYGRLGEAEQQNITPRPQLLKVEWEPTLKWIQEMKVLANSAITNGTFSTDSALLVQQRDSIIGTTTNEDNVAPFSDEGGVGVAIPRSTLRLDVPSMVSENVFNPPTTAAVSEMMPPKKKRQKPTKAIDPVLAERQAVLAERRAKAKATMELHNISADPKDGKKRRCPICNKYITGFKFKGTYHIKKIKYCPLVDDASQFHNHEQLLKDMKREENSRYQRKKRQKQPESEDNSAP